MQKLKKSQNLTASDVISLKIYKWIICQPWANQMSFQNFFKKIFKR